jgi:hypothetical protein
VLVLATSKYQAKVLSDYPMLQVEHIRTFWLVNEKEEEEGGEMVDLGRLDAEIGTMRGEYQIGCAYIT